MELRLRYIENCFGDDDEKKLVGFLDSCEWKSLSESKNSRKVQHYGYIYDYKSGKTTQTYDAPTIKEIYNKGIGDSIFFIDL